MINIKVVYFQNVDNTWDAHVKGDPRIQVDSAKDLCQARTFIRMLADEELETCLIVEEMIKYYIGV